MDASHYLCFAAALAFIAFLYSSVGHGGASGYLAIMALCGFLPMEMKPTALVLNIVTSLMASWMFWRAGHFSARLFLPLAASSIPMAFLGGRWTAPSTIFHFLIAFALVAAAISLVVRMNPPSEQLREPSLGILLLTGALLGFLSGLIGVGGGIFLTPLMLLLCWCKPKTASSVSALFILVNSIAGLAGNPHSVVHLPTGMPWLLAIVLVAGGIGSLWGSGVATNRHIRQALALVLVIAAAKMILTI